MQKIMLQCYKNKKYNNINSLSAIFCNIGNVTTMLQCYNDNIYNNILGASDFF